MARRGYRRVLAAAGVGLALWLVIRAGHHPAPTAAGPAPGASAGSSGPPSGPGGSLPPSASSTSSDYQPARFAGAVRTRAAEAGVDPQLLMAILYNEAYKPHDPALERSWQKLKPDSAFGIANMHRAAFDDTKQGRPFEGRSWDELPDDPDLAVRAAAWYLHDLAAQLPAHRSGPYQVNELLALGYNAGAGNMLAFARGAGLGPDARAYLDHLHESWPKAVEALGR